MKPIKWMLYGEIMVISWDPYKTQKYTLGRMWNLCMLKLVVRRVTVDLSGRAV